MDLEKIENGQKGVARRGEIRYNKNQIPRIRAKEERAMKKRVIVLLLAVVLSCALALPGMGAQEGRAMRFSDVPEDIWYYDNVRDLYEAGIIDGLSDQIFGGDDPVAWGQAFKLITLAIGCAVPAPVEGERWDYPYIELALDNRLVYAFDAAYLSDVPTRLQVAHMVARALDLLSIPQGDSPFADCDDGYVTHLYEKGILEGAGHEDGQMLFVPDAPITRAEMAAILWRVYNLDVSQGMFRHSNYWVEPFSAEEVAPFGYDPSLFALDGSFMTYGDGSVAYEVGVDVSEFQLDIDWQAVADAGVDFAILRIGGRFMQSGGLYEDQYFRRNLEGAKAAGLKVGVYFFSQAINAQEGLEEAEFVLDLLGGAQLDYPVVCDWEYLGGSSSRTYGVEPAEVTAGIDAFCARVEQAGYQAMVYFNAYCGYIKMDLRALTDYDFWYAQYAAQPSYRYHFQMWQYSSSGRVPGINGDVDMNISFVPYGV